MSVNWEVLPANLRFEWTGIVTHPNAVQRRPIQGAFQKKKMRRLICTL